MNVCRTLDFGLEVSGSAAKFRSGARSYSHEAFLPFSAMARAIKTESAFRQKLIEGAVEVIGRRE